MRLVVMKELPGGGFSARDVTSGFEAIAPTREEAFANMRASVTLDRFARDRMRTIRRQSTVEFSPQDKCYVAKCGPVLGTGFTRQDAFDDLIRALHLLDEAMQQYTIQQQQTERAGADQAGQDVADQTAAADTNPKE